MLTHGLNAASLFDDTGVVVQLNRLTEDSAVKLGRVEGGPKSPTGSEYWGGDKSELLLHTLDVVGRDQVLLWQKTGTPVRAAGYGPTGVLQWYEATLVEVDPDEVKGASGGRVGYTVRLFREGHGRHDVHFALDALARLGWADSNLDAIPDGYEISGDWYDYEFLAGVATPIPVANANPAAELRSLIWPFPVSGARLTLSLEADSAALGNYDLAVEALDVTGQALATASAQMALQNPRQSVALTVPAGAYYLRTVLARTRAGNSNASVDLLRPSLRVDGSAEDAHGGVATAVQDDSLTFFAFL